MTVSYDYDQTNIDHLRAVIAEQEQTIKYLHEHCKAEEVENVKLQDENVKLRKIVLGLYEYRQLYFKTGIYPTDHGVTERRMRELGLEVSDD